MSIALRLLAPAIAVVVFWTGLANAWLAILAYHAQILIWSGGRLPALRRSRRRRLLLLALPLAAAGPVLYALLPEITRAELVPWLADHQLSGLSLVLMIPYFGIIHPMLEQLHWAPLREESPVAHFCFAGYHLLVLASLLRPGWLVIAFALLLAASWLGEPVGAHPLAHRGGLGRDHRGVDENVKEG